MSPVARCLCMQPKLPFVQARTYLEKALSAYRLVAADSSVEAGKLQETDRAILHLQNAFE